jgi:hypothetical protein
LAPVQKPLVSAGDVTNKGNDLYYFDNEAYIIAKGSKLQKVMREAFDQAMKDTRHYRDTITMYREANIYNIYVKVGLSSAGSPASSREICPADSPESGFQRRGKGP